MAEPNRARGTLIQPNRTDSFHSCSNFLMMRRTYV